MSKPSWKWIERGMQDERIRTPLRPPEDFWSDFKARVRLRQQELPEPEIVRRPSPGLRWGLAGACAALLLGWFTWRGLPHAAGREMTHINSLEVVASHSAVVIMENESTDSTILWIVGMNIEGEGST